MAIHHDKLAYGKLESVSEELSEETLLRMAKMLSEGKVGEEESKEESKEEGEEEKQQGADGGEKAKKMEKAKRE